jgi:ribosomal protein S18 acetylase RimI-like enzyme
MTDGAVGPNPAARAAAHGDVARPATELDLPRLAELCRLAQEELAGKRGGWIWVRREARGEPVEASLAAAIEDARQLVVVGEVDGYRAGYGVVRVEELRDGSLLAVVDDLFTEPQFREVGLGETLMNELVAFARQHGCVGIDSWALPGDRETKNFFEGFGLKARGIVVHWSFADG